MDRRWTALGLLTLAAVAPGPAARAQDDAPSLEFGYPVVTRRPVIERELEFRVSHAKEPARRVTELTAALEVPVLPRWQIELSMPFVVADPRREPAQGGPGDLELENKVSLYASLEHRALVAAGFELRLPSGSERRGLGGEAAVEPFVTGALALGDVDLLASVAYEFNVNSHVHGPHEQELTASAAALYWVTRRFAPLLELATVTRVRGQNDEDAPPLTHRTQVSVTPGFNLKVQPRTTLRLGVEVPLTHARRFEYAVRGGIVREF